jgi:hypothetical protein
MAVMPEDATQSTVMPLARACSISMKHEAHGREKSCLFHQLLKVESIRP